MKYIVFYLEDCGTTTDYCYSKVSLSHVSLINGLKVEDLKFEKLLSFTQLPYIKIENESINTIIMTSKIVKFEYE